MLLEEAVTVSVWASLVAPEVMPERLTVWRPAFSLMVRLASALSVGGLVDRVDGDREGAGDDVIAGAAIVDGDGDGGGAVGIGDGGEGDRTGGVGAGVVDRGSRDEARVAGGGGDRQRLDLVGRPGGDAGEVDGLEAGILVDGEIGQRVERGRLVWASEGIRAETSVE